MGSLPMNFYFQKMDIAKLEVSLQLMEVECSCCHLYCVGLLLSVSGSVLAEQEQEVNISLNFCVSRKLKFDYLDSQH